MMSSKCTMDYERKPESKRMMPAGREEYLVRTVDEGLRIIDEIVCVVNRHEAKVQQKPPVAPLPVRTINPVPRE